MLGTATTPLYLQFWIIPHNSTVWTTYIGGPHQDKVISYRPLNFQICHLPLDNRRQDWRIYTQHDVRGELCHSTSCTNYCDLRSHMIHWFEEGSKLQECLTSDNLVPAFPTRRFKLPFKYRSSPTGIPLIRLFLREFDRDDISLALWSTITLAKLSSPSSAFLLLQSVSPRVYCN